MTKDEWLASISADTGMTVQTILEARAKRGRYPVACDCGEGICQGWRWSDPLEDEQVAIRMGLVTQKVHAGTKLVVDKHGVKVRPRWWWRLIRRGGRIRWSS